MKERRHIPPQGPDSLFHQYPGLVGIGTGTISLVERYYLVVKPALALDIGIYRLESDSPFLTLRLVISSKSRVQPGQSLTSGRGLLR